MNEGQAHRVGRRGTGGGAYASMPLAASAHAHCYLLLKYQFKVYLIRQ